jgi:hypothetical protein
MTDHEIAELRALGEELRAVFADERRAIGKLDHAQLALLAETKRRIVMRLDELRATASPDPSLRQLFEALQVEARATALLAATATDLVNKVLGRETSGYDRRAAKVTTNHPLRMLTAY